MKDQTCLCAVTPIFSPTWRINKRFSSIKNSVVQVKDNRPFTTAREIHYSNSPSNTPSG